MFHRIRRPGLVAATLLATALLLAASAQEGAQGERPYLGIAAEASSEEGVVVQRVEPNGPAAQAGLQAGDVITRIDGQNIKGFEALADAVTQHKVGDKVTLGVRRDGSDREISVTLGTRPRDRFEARPMPTLPPMLGVQTQPLTPELQKHLGVKTDKGALVSDVLAGSPAEKAGLKEQDVIVSLDGQTIASPQDLREAVQKAGTGKQVTLKIERGKETKELQARLDPAGGPFPRLERPFVPPGFATDFMDTPAKVRALERTVQELERRVRELEQKLAEKK